MFHCLLPQLFPSLMVRVVDDGEEDPPESDGAAIRDGALVLLPDSGPIAYIKVARLAAVHSGVACAACKHHPTIAF